MVIGLLLFLIPGGANRGVRLLDWETAEKLPWGVLLLFGGGLALSAQFSSSGLTEWIGEVSVGLGALPLILIVAVFAAIILFLTELTSNTATAATFIPVVGGVALGLQLDPLILTIPVALAATCAFMLPVATPPNAVAYGSGYVTIGRWSREGSGSTSSASSSSPPPCTCSPSQCSTSCCESGLTQADLCHG